jgi:hypothetical protein
MAYEEEGMTALLALFPTGYEVYFAPPYFVGWGTLALINAGLAQGKKKSGLLWFLLSLLLGPDCYVAYCALLRPCRKLQ